MSEEVKQETQKCPFCMIVNGEIPSHKVVENDEFMSFLDINPANKGHTLIIPKKHVPISPMLEPKLAGSLANIIKVVNQKLIQTYSKSTTIFIANGGVAGQKAPHLIIHVIPRDDNDGINLNPKRSEKKGWEEMHKKIVEGIGGSEKTDVLMEDDDLTILHPKQNFVNGEVKMFVRKKLVILEQVPEDLFTKMLQVTNKMSALLFDKLQMQGTNILIQNGPSAGQTEDHFSINIIPRMQDDGIELEWEPKQETAENLTKTLEEIKGTEKKEEEAKFVEEQKKQVEEKPKEAEELKEDNYLAKSLNRLP